MSSVDERPVYPEEPACPNMDAPDGPTCVDDGDDDVRGPEPAHEASCGVNEDDDDLTQQLQPMGNTANLFLAADETAVIGHGDVAELPFATGKHSIIRESDYLDSSAFEPKTPVAPSASPDEGQTRPSRGRRALAWICAIVLVAALAGLGAYFAYRHQVHERQLAPQPIGVSISAPGYDLIDSPIPFHVEGTDVDGNAVDKVCFVGPDGWGIEAPRGQYVITVAASPLLDDAQYYVVPDTRLEVTVPDDASEDAPLYFDVPRFEFLFANPADITDEQIDASYAYAIDSGFDANRADEYRAALVAKRDEAFAREQATAEKLERVDAATSALEAAAGERGLSGVSSQLVALDGDDLPELLLAANAASAYGAMCFVYAYDDFSHQVVELCSAAGGADHAPGIWYSTSSHEVCFRTVGTSSETYTFYSITSNAAIFEYAYSHSSVPNPDNPDARIESYALGDTAISEQGFKDGIARLSKFSYLASPTP